MERRAKDLEIELRRRGGEKLRHEVSRAGSDDELRESACVVFLVLQFATGPPVSERHRIDQVVVRDGARDAEDAGLHLSI